MSMKRLSIGIVGLGRMGARHALNLLTRTPRCTLVAACSPEAKEREWAEANLAPYGTKIYASYDEMLKHPDMVAVLVATSTSVHAEFAVRAIEAGKHVLCEKPLSTKLDEAKGVVTAAKAHPELKTMCGFSRRFDDSYRDALSKVQSGLIGKPIILRSQTCDKYDPSGYFVSYSALSGGIFVDCSIHDIDLSLMFFGEDSVPKALWSTGISACHPELAALNDADNAVGVVEFWGGRIAYFFASRIMAHGQEDATEIIGTGGKLSVNKNPQSNLVEIADHQGIRREVPDNYYGRFEYAFVNEVNEYVACVLDDKPVPLSIESAYKALEIGAALQESLITGKKLEFDESGKRTN